MKKIIHCTMLIVGIIFLACSWSLLSCRAILLAIPSGLGLVAAYFWIRKDIWKSDIQILTDEHRSTRADCRVSFLMLFLIAIAQAFSPEQAVKGQGQFFLIIILLGVPIGDFVAPYADKAFSWVIKRVK